MSRIDIEPAFLRIGILAGVAAIAGSSLLIQGDRDLTKLIIDENKEARASRVDPYESEYWSAQRTLGNFYLVEDAFKTLGRKANSIPSLADMDNFRQRIETLHEDPVYQVAKRTVDERRDPLRQADQDRQRTYDVRRDQIMRKTIGGVIIFLSSLGAIVTWSSYRIHQIDSARKPNLNPQVA